MGIKQALRNKILQLDMLSVIPTLRVRGSSSVETVFGGGLSLIIIIALSVIFFQSLVTVANKIDISYSQQFQDDPNSAVDITSLQFAVGIESQDFTVNPRYFQVNVIQNSMTNTNGAVSQTQTPIMLNFCDLNDWSQHGTEFQHQFNGFGMSKMFCLSPSQAVSLYGYDGSFPYRFLTLQIRMCNGSIPGCASTSAVQTLMGSHITSSSLYRVRLFIVNTLFSPNNQNPVSKMIQKSILLSFTSSTATVGYIYMGDYSIGTDQSVLPVTDYSYVTGSYIDTSTTTTIPITGTSNFLINLDFYKSTKSLTITRSFGKIDSLLSYIGGLFSLILTAVSFFFASYSSHCYELAVAQAILSLDKDGRKYRQRNFTFLTYMKLCIYQWFGCFGCNLDWKNMQQIVDLKEEVQNQLDINIILKRIRHLEAVSKILMSEHRYISLYLAHPPTVEQSKQMKQMVNFYDELLQRIQSKEEPPTLNLKQVANEKDTIQILEDGEIVNSKIKRRLFLTTGVDKVFIEALSKLKGDKDYELIKEQISKQIMESVPKDMNISNEAELNRSVLSFQQFQKIEFNRSNFQMIRKDNQ